MSARHDEYVVNWRADRPGDRKPMAVRRKPSMLQRAWGHVMCIAQAIRSLPDGEPSNWRDAAVFIVGTVWGGMVTLGFLLAMAARHAR